MAPSAVARPRRLPVFRRAIASHDRGHLGLRQLVDADGEVERLALWQRIRHSRHALVGAQARLVGERHARQQHLRPEVEPVARVQRHRDAVDADAASAAPRRRSESSSMSSTISEPAWRLSTTKRQLRRMGAGHAAAQAIAELHEPRAKALAGAPQEVAERPQQRLLPERRAALGTWSRRRDRRRR